MLGVPDFPALQLEGKTLPFPGENGGIILKNPQKVFFLRMVYDKITLKSSWMPRGQMLARHFGCFSRENKLKREGGRPWSRR